MPFTLKEWQEHRLMHRYNTEKGLEMVGVAIQKYIENSIRWQAPLHVTRDVGGLLCMLHVMSLSATL